VRYLTMCVCYIVVRSYYFSRAVGLCIIQDPSRIPPDHRNRFL
jgi:hypothetical protein